MLVRSTCCSGQRIRRGPRPVEDPVRCGVEASVDVSNDEPWRNSMLWTVLVVLLILWILGFSFQVAGNLIHLLLVVALIVLVLQLVTGRRL
jgi:hypothetical protein